MKIPKADLRELDAALAREQRPYVRKRFLAVKNLLAGKSPALVAKAATVGQTTVYRWIRMMQQAGWESLACDERGRKPRKPMKATAAVRARAAIRVALEGKPDAMTRTRLTAVDQLLTGKPLELVAGDARITPKVAQRWLFNFEDKGLGALLGRKQVRPLHLNADGAELRALAAKEKNRHVARRILAMAHLAEGKSKLEAALAVKANEWSVHAWLADFLEGGVEALRHHTAGRAPKLNPEQLAELAAIIGARPGISCPQLCELVKQRFRVRYTVSGMWRLVTEGLARARKGC